MNDKECRVVLQRIADRYTTEETDRKGTEQMTGKPFAETLEREHDTMILMAREALNH